MEKITTPEAGSMMARWAIIGMGILGVGETSTTARAEVAFTQVVRTGTPAPGNGSAFGRFDGLSISLRTGNVGFRGFSSVYGVYNTAGGLHKVADSNTAVPGGSGTFGTLLLDPSFDGTNSAFVGGDAEMRSGIYTDMGGLHAIADTHTPVPSAIGNFASVGTPAIRGGHVAFRGYGPNNLRGVYSTVGGLHRVADSTMAIPEGGGTFSNFHFQWLDFDGQNAYFHATSSAGIRGIYTDAGGALHAAARVGDRLPDGRTIHDVSELSADDGALAFNFGSGSETGIASTYGGTLSIIADPRTTIPGQTRTFAAAVRPALDDGSVAFLGFWPTPFGVDPDHGIYIRRGTDLIKVVDSNEALDGREIAYLNITNESHEGDQIAFQVEFDDGTQAIYVATIPEPAGVTLLGVGTVGLLARRKPRS